MRIDTQQGLTMPELLVSLTLISTLSMNAYSQFSHVLQENRMAFEVNLFMSALHLARSEVVSNMFRTF
jgi:prepilin-type N-terminal cleavage/methylation domain-containing protein